MSVATRGQECAPRPDYAMQLVFERLPQEEQVFTVSALSRDWRRRAQPEQLRLQERRRQLESQRQQYWHAQQYRYSAHAVPLWLVQKAWPELTRAKRVDLFCRAARHGDVGALRWMWEQDRQLRWLWEQDKRPLIVLDDPQRSRAYTAAAAGGHLTTLQLLWAMRHKCGLHTDVYAAAAEGGHLTVLQWLRACNRHTPCPWGKRVCAAATGTGQLAVLQWLRAQQPPCPWGKSTRSAAAGTGRLTVLQWLRAQQPPCPWG